MKNFEKKKGMALYRALYDYTSEDPDDLQFKANDVIAVTDPGEAGNPESWW